MITIIDSDSEDEQEQKQVDTNKAKKTVTRLARVRGEIKEM